MRNNGMSIMRWWHNRGRDYREYPPDNNGDLLWRLHRNTNDVSKRLKMDFFFVFRDEGNARHFASVAVQNSFDVAVAYYDEKEGWQVTCSITMVPTQANVSATQEVLMQLAAQLGGAADGWGCEAR